MKSTISPPAGVPPSEGQPRQPNSSKYTPTQARKALLKACIKTKSGSREVAVKANVLGEVVQLLSDMEHETEQLRQQVAGLKQELGEQEVQQLQLVRENAAFRQSVTEDLGFLHDSTGCISDSDMMDEIAAAADRLGVELISPEPAPPAPACPGNCGDCGNAGAGPPPEALGQRQGLAEGGSNA